MHVHTHTHTLISKFAEFTNCCEVNTLTMIDYKLPNGELRRDAQDTGRTTKEGSET